MEQNRIATVVDVAPQDRLTYWELAAEREREAGATFDLLAVELLSLGCASETVVRTRVAGEESRSHSETCFRIASLHGDAELVRSRRARRIKAREYVSPVLIAVSTFRELLLDEVLRVEALVNGLTRLDSEIQRRLVSQLIAGKRQHLDLARKIIVWAIGDDDSVPVALHTLAKQHSSRSIDDFLRSVAMPGTFDDAAQVVGFTNACETRRREAFEWLDGQLAPRLIM